MPRTPLALLLLALLAPVARADLETWARRFAPVLRQDTADERDYIAAFDFDGNWDGDDNWENQPHFPAKAVAYYAGVETATHAYLTYAFFHARDSSWFDNPVLSHENDLEGVVLVLEKGAEDVRPVASQSIFHWDFLRLEVPGGYPARDPEGTLRFEGERPVYFCEAWGHGITAWDGSEFPGGDGVVYRPGEVAEVPEHPDDRQVSYRLVPIESTLWARRHEVGPGKAYAAVQDFGGETYGYTYYGTSYGDHKAHAPWGWQAEGLPRGTFFLDPAAMIADQFQVPELFAREYLPNPFTGSAAGRRSRAANRYRAWSAGPPGVSSP